MRVAIIGGLLGVIAAVAAAIVASVMSRPGPSAPAPGQAEQHQALAAKNSSASVKLALERVAFDDGGTQMGDLGCPNGHFFAAPRIEMAKNLHMEPESVAGIGHLLPGAMFVAIDTELPAGEYIKVSALEIAIERYAAEPGRPPLIIETTTCADEGPDSGQLAFNVILDPRAQRIPLLPVASRVGLTIQQDVPTILDFELNARNPGWYRINVILRYRHGTTERVATLPRGVDVFFPQSGDYDWFHYFLGGPARQLKHSEIRTVIDKIGQYSASTFPASPAPLTARSGLLPPATEPSF